MTIRLLRNINNVGVANDVVSLNAALEARLVSANNAVYVSGPDIGDSGVPVMGKADPVTGMLGNQTVGNKVIVTPKKMACSSRLGGLTVGGVVGTTTNLALKTEAEAPFSRVRFRLYSEAGPATNFKIAACVTETAANDTANNRSQPVVGGVAYPAAQSAVGEPGWQIGSVAGVTNFDWPGTGTTDAPKELVTDWFDLPSVPRADGGTRPLVMFRLEHDGVANGNIGSVSNVEWAAISGSGYSWYRIHQAPNISGGGSVTDLTKTAASLGTVFPWCAVEFDYSVPCATVMGIGDSNMETAGNASVGKMGTWGWQAAALLSTTYRPVTFFNAGRAGGSALLYSKNGVNEIASVKPKAVLYAAGTSNDAPMTANKLALWKARLSAIMTACDDVGAALIVYGPFPCGGSYLTTDSYRLEMISYCTSLAANGLFEYVNTEFLGTGATPNVLAAANTVDNTHLSNSAEVTLAALFAPIIEKYI